MGVRVITKDYKKYLSLDDKGFIRFIPYARRDNGIVETAYIVDVREMYNLHPYYISDDTKEKCKNLPSEVVGEIKLFGKEENPILKFDWYKYSSDANNKVYSNKKYMLKALKIFVKKFISNHQIVKSHIKEDDVGKKHLLEDAGFTYEGFKDYDDGYNNKRILCYELNGMLKME